MRRSRALPGDLERKLRRWRGRRRGRSRRARPGSGPIPRRGRARGPAREERVLDAMLDEDDGRPFVCEAAHEAQQSLAASGSRFARGSSRTTRRGTSMSVPAMATCWGSPPESWSVVRSARCSSSARAIDATERLGHLRGGTPRFSGPTPARRARWRPTSCLRGSWRTVPTSRARSRSRCSGRAAVDANAPGHLAAIRMRDQAVQRADEVLFRSRWAGYQEYFVRLDAQREVGMVAPGAAVSK